MGNQILISSHIEAALKNFWLDIIDLTEETPFIRIQFKLKTVDGDFKSISYLQTVNKNDLDKLIVIFQQYWNLSNDDYHRYPVDSIIFTYKIDLKKGSIGESKLVTHKKVNKTKSFKFGGRSFHLPITMDITKWSGTVQFNEGYTSAVVYINNSPLEYHVNLYNNYQIVKVMVKDNVLLEFTETVNNLYDLSSFTRKIKRQIFIFENGELIVKQIERKVNFLTKISKDSGVSNKFITMDLETRNLNGILQPYCVSTFYIDSQGFERVASFYLKDYYTSERMLKAAIESLFDSNIDGYKVYLHNFSNFDGVFLIRILSELSPKVKPIIRDGRIIDVSIKYGHKLDQTLYFRDSYLLVTASLDKLAKDFNIECQKGIFPYKFVDDPNIKLSYFGPTPDFSYFDGISLEQYNEYKSQRLYWDLEHEAKYYCEMDCKVLYLVIKTFSKLIFELFNLDTLKYPTLPSLAMGIYRSNFLNDNIKIPLIDGNIYNDLKKAYTGGMVDVYKPTNDPNTKVFSYDVNSLYPHSMKNYAAPVGAPKYFVGDIFKINPAAFGVFEVEVVAPNNLKYPVLQTKVQINGNTRTISPLGNWTGWYLSSEILNAMSFGYKFKILRGYLFDKDFIFSEYVDSIYKLKLNSNPGTPNYTIAKLTLNSLYGKFGTDPEFETHVIVDSEKAKEYYNKYVITNVINLGNNKELLTFFNQNYDKKDRNPTVKNSSISIALSVTAYARIHMAHLKKVMLDSGLSLYYMDTDGIAISGELDPIYIGKELGKLKLEHVFNEVVYLCPKVYAGKTDTYQHSKVKGLKNKIFLEDLKPLLKKDVEPLVLKQDKMFKNIGAGNISIREEIYTLMLTENKRELIFNSEGIFVDTKPYVLSEGKIVKQTFTKGKKK